jgi:hypothetical protein
MEAFLIRLAILSEQRELEQLQLRASLGNTGDRDALLGHPDAIELPVTKSPEAEYLSLSARVR